jgi:hypothetical protein
MYDPQTGELLPPPTEEELAQIVADAKAALYPKGWSWSDDAVSYVAPVSPPDDGYPYLWDEDAQSWIPFPGYPRDDIQA